MIPGLGRPSGEENGNPPSILAWTIIHGQRRLAGYIPWGRRVGHNLATKRREAQAGTVGKGPEVDVSLN